MGPVPRDTAPCHSALLENFSESLTLTGLPHGPSPWPFLLTDGASYALTIISHLESRTTLKLGVGLGTPDTA